MSESRRRVLVIDDDTDLRESTAAVLRLLGHEVITASDGLTGMEEGRRFDPHLVLLDVGLAGESGHDIARRMRAEPWGQRTVLAAMTGRVQEVDRQQAERAGFDVHLPKPVPLDAFRALLAGLDPVGTGPRDAAG